LDVLIAWAIRSEERVERARKVTLGIHSIVLKTF
jgi:hypothetical protein